MKNHVLFTFLALFIFCLSPQAEAQQISAERGYTPQIGVVVSMLDDLKSRITRQVRNLSQEETDFLLDENANRIGAMILHLAATEKFYQVYTFENREYNASEAEFWNTPMNLGSQGRSELVGKPISYYLEKWDEVRTETKRLLKTKDDNWFNAKTGSMNNHWGWYHVMEHQANHMGQIALISKRAR